MQTQYAVKMKEKQVQMCKKVVFWGGCADLCSRKMTRREYLTACGSHMVQ